jgi:hypothetical protein
MKKIKDTPDFVKEETTGALVNTSASGLRAYRSARADRRKVKRQQKAIGQLEQRLANMEELVNRLLSSRKTEQ